MKQAVETTFEQAKRMNAPRAIALCQCFNGALEFQAGHWNVADTALREAISLYKNIGAASGEALAWQRLGVLQTARGELDAAMDSFNEGVIVAERATMRAHCLTRLYASMTRNRLESGALKEADTYLEMGLSMGERHGNCSTCDALLLPVAVSVRLKQGALPEAVAFCQKLEDAADEYGSNTWIAMAQQAKGEVLSSSHQLDEAITIYTEAYEGFRAAGYDYEAARCLYAIAEIYSERNAPGDQQQADNATEDAERIFEKLSGL